MNAVCLHLLQANTGTNITAKESLKKSKLLGNEVLSSCFGHADLRSDCSKS